MENNFNVHHRGRLKQIPIYLGKFFRMFIFLNDWKVLPMAAIIAVLVAFVAGGSMFQTMEGTVMGAMAITCVCLWNGCFNSIQVVCRERDIVKREHRSGMHISSYISAHMIYQAFLCLVQSIITLVVFIFAGMAIPTEGLITKWFYLDLCITFFLITYSADMMSLMISCIVRNTTAAMTVMPLVLIVQLIFSGIMFTLSGNAAQYTSLTIAYWGMRSICAQANYNSQPMVSLWNQLFNFKNFDLLAEFPDLKDALSQIPGIDQKIIDTPILSVLQYMEKNGLKDDFLLRAGQAQANSEYVTSTGNILYCWIHLIGFALLFALLAMVFLKFIDKDKR